MSSPDTPARGFSVAQSAPTQQVPPAATSVHSTPRPTAGTAPSYVAPTAHRARRARLVLARVDPWSVMKLSFLLSIALGIVLVVAVVVLWSILDAMGVFTAVSSTIQDLTASDSGGGFDLLVYVGFSRVVGVATILALVDVVLITALSTLAAFLYNITASLVGGLHVTLAEDA